MKRYFFILISLTLILILGGCAPPPPDHVENICYIFEQYPDWYWNAQDAEKKWGIPVPVLMSIIYQESSFRANAKPPREKLLWIIPWKRPTSAYGYSQAIDGTWVCYKNETNQTFANRDAFGSASDFIGWYANRIHKKTGVSMTNAYAIYLAYHEGTGNYLKGTYKQKTWLMNVARRVEQRAQIYRSQLAVCKNSLPQRSWWKSS